MHSIHEYRVILIIGRLGWVLGLSCPLLGYGPHVLGNGPQFMNRVILIMGRLGWVVCLSVCPNGFCNEPHMLGQGLG